MIDPIHQSEEQRANVSTVGAIKEHSAKTGEVLQAVQEGSKTTERKIDEVKSASLITNKLLKEISAPFKGVSILTIKGDKGDKGDIGPRGPQGAKGDSIRGADGKDGKDGVGKDGKDGKDGESVSGKDGKDGVDGKDGSPDTPDQVIEKVNQSKKRINPERIKGLAEVMKSVDDMGANNNPLGTVAGGSAPVKFLSNGVVISQFVTEINLSTNLTAVYSGSGRVTITGNAGGGTTYSETPGGAIDGANKVYTTAHAITTVINLAINGQFLHPAEYTVAGSGFTMGTALPASLSGTGFTIIYS